MGWEKCSILGCGSNRHSRGLGIFKIPSDKFKKGGAWGKSMMKVLKGREGDELMQECIAQGIMRICEKHFKPSDVETYTLPEIFPPRRRLRAGALPCRNLPPKLTDVTSQPLSQLSSSGDETDSMNENSSVVQIKYTVKKYRSIGVDTKDQIETKNFSCQVGESYLSPPNDESKLPIPS